MARIRQLRIYKDPYSTRGPTTVSSSKEEEEDLEELSHKHLPLTSHLDLKAVRNRAPFASIVITLPTCFLWILPLKQIHSGVAICSRKPGLSQCVVIASTYWQV